MPLSALKIAYISKVILAKSNSEQIAKIVRIAKELGIEAATPYNV